MKGDKYRHQNGNTYTVLAESQTKIDGVWHNSITYQGEDGQIWNRLREDFLSGNFEEVLAGS